MKATNILIYPLIILLLPIISACGNSAENNDDDNDTNAVFSVNDKPPAKLPAKPTPQTGKRKCVTPSMPAEVTFSYVYDFADRSEPEAIVEINRIKQFENKKNAPISKP